MSALETLRRWFEAFRDEPASARDLWSEDAALHTADGGFAGGFDDLLAWYGRRLELEGPGFSWHAVDVMGGERYGAAIIRLRSDARPGGWDQHAVYEVVDGKIRQVWLHEL